MKELPVYQLIARAIYARDMNLPCSPHWAEKLDKLAREFLPSGAGFDSGTSIDPRSTCDKLILNTQFHHLDIHGSYSHWTSHAVIVRPCMVYGLNIQVKGRDSQDIKSHILEVFDCMLRYVPNQSTLEHINV